MRCVCLTALLFVPIFVPAAAPAREIPRLDLRGHRGSVEQVLFTPDGESLASFDDKAAVKMWEVSTGKALRGFAPRGKNIGPGALATTYGARRVESIAFDASGAWLAEAATEPSRASSLRIWNAADASEKLLVTDSAHNVRAVAFSPDGKLLAANESTADRLGHKITFFDAASGERLGELRDDRLAANKLAFTPDGTWLISAGGREMRLWDVAERKLRHAVTCHKDSIQSIAVSPDGQLVATCSRKDDIKIWKVAGGTLEREIEEAGQEGVLAVAFSPSGRTLASGGVDKRVKLWKVASGKERETLWAHVDRVTCVAFSPDGKTLATGSRDKTILLWDIDEPSAEKDAAEKDDEGD